MYVVGYTGFVAFTNYGDGHNSTKEDAVAALLAQNERRVEGSAAYPLVVVADGDDDLGFAVLIDGEVLAGTAECPLAPVDDAAVTDGTITSVAGFDVLSRNTVLTRQAEVTQLRVPVSDDPNDGSIRTQDARSGYVYRLFANEGVAVCCPVAARR